MIAKRAATAGFLDMLQASVCTAALSSSNCPKGAGTDRCITVRTIYETHSPQSFQHSACRAQAIELPIDCHPTQEEVAPQIPSHVAATPDSARYTKKIRGGRRRQVSPRDPPLLSFLEMSFCTKLPRPTAHTC